MCISLVATYDNNDLAAVRKEKISKKNKNKRIMLKYHERNHKLTVNDHTQFENVNTNRKNFL